MISTKKILYMLMCFIIISTTFLNAQDFIVEVGEQYLVDTVGSEIIFDFSLINSSTSNNISASIVRSELVIPNTWSTSLCFENCFAPFIDSISTSEDFGSSPLSPGESRSMSLHVFPLEENGESIIELRFFNEINTDEEYIIEFRAATPLTSVDNEANRFDFQLSQNYPNPFNPSTTINYTIPVNSSGDLTFVSLKVYDILGCEIKTLVSNYQRSGKYSIKFDPQQNLPSGVYFYKLSTENHQLVKKMILEK